MSNEQEQQQTPHDDMELLKLVQYRASLASEDLRQVLQAKDGVGGKDSKAVQTSAAATGQRLSKPGAFKGSPGRSLCRARSPCRSLMGNKKPPSVASLLLDESLKSHGMDESMKSRCCTMDESIKSQHQTCRTSSCVSSSSSSAETASTTICTSTMCSSCCNVLQARPMALTIGPAEQQQPPAAVMVEAKLVDGEDPTLSRDSLKKIIAQLQQRLQDAPIAEVVETATSTESSSNSNGSSSTSNNHQTNLNKRSSWIKLTKIMSASDMRKMLKRSTSMGGDKKELAKKMSLKRRSSMGGANLNNNELSRSSWHASSSSSSSISRSTSMDKVKFWRKK